MTTTLKLLFGLIIFSSCSNSYKLYPDRITSGVAIENGFHVSEIMVSAFEENGRLAKYTPGMTIFCGPNPALSGFYTDSFYNEREKGLSAAAWKTCVKHH